MASERFYCRDSKPANPALNNNAENILEGNYEHAYDKQKFTAEEYGNKESRKAVDQITGIPIANSMSHACYVIAYIII